MSSDFYIENSDTFMTKHSKIHSSPIPEPYLLIMEYVMCGKLLTYLRERRSRPDRFSGSGALTSRDLTVFAYCVARGMDYIASKGVRIF